MAFSGRIKGKSQWENGEFTGVVRIATPDGIGFDEDMADEIHNHRSYYSVDRHKGDKSHYISRIGIPSTILNSIEKIKDKPYASSIPGLKTAIHCALSWSAESIWNHTPVQSLRKVIKSFKMMPQQGTPLEEFTAEFFRMKIPTLFETSKHIIKSVPVSEKVYDTVSAMSHDIGMTQSEICILCLLFYLSRQENVAEVYRRHYRTKLENVYQVMLAKAQCGDYLVQMLREDCNAGAPGADDFMPPRLRIH